jgi:hypothetical protein
MRRRRWFLGAALVGIVLGVASTSAFALTGREAANESFGDLCWTAGDMRLALTTDRRADVFVGRIAQGKCLAYRDGNGTTMMTLAPVGATPVGPAVALKALDTATGEYVVVAAVPDGYTDVSVRGNSVAITKNVFVIDARDARDGMVIKGPAGVERLDLAALSN